MSLKLLDYNKIESAVKSLDPTKPVFIFGLLRYRKTADYSSTSLASASLPPVSGRDAYYGRYIVAFRERQPEGAGPIFVGKAVQPLLASFIPEGKFGDGAFEPGNEKEWDDVAIVKYNSMNDFKDMVLSEDYQKIAMPHRIAAIEEYILIACEQVVL